MCFCTMMAPCKLQTVNITNPHVAWLDTQRNIGCYKLSGSQLSSFLLVPSYFEPMVSTHVKDEISKIMQSKQGYILQWNEIKKVLIDNSLAYTSQLEPGLLLVHPQNRGGTGINAWSMHAKGAIICQSGADLNLLMGSVCFELSLDPEKKKEQVAFNKAMCDISQGMMAEPSGMERYLSVSKGHTSQFCKAINHCAKTTQTSLASGNGCLGPHLLQRDADLKTMCAKGWEWLIITSQVEEAFPGLPQLVENACNSTNAAFESQSEVQLMHACIAHVKSMGGPINYEELAASLCQAGPVTGYASAVGKFVQLYGGMVSHVT